MSPMEIARNPVIQADPKDKAALCKTYKERRNAPLLARAEKAIGRRSADWL